MDIKALAREQFEKFSDELATADFSNDIPPENSRENFILKIREQFRPGGNKAGEIYDRLCSDHLRNLEF